MDSGPSTTIPLGKSFWNAFNAILPLESPPNLPSSEYGYFLALEKTPSIILFGKTIAVSFVLQFVLLYTTWFFTPSFARNRRGLAWTLTFYCSLVLLTFCAIDFGYLRTTFFTGLSLDRESLGLKDAGATMFSQWTPSFHAWVLNLVKSSSQDLAASSTSVAAALQESFSLSASAGLRMVGTIVSDSTYRRAAFAETLYSFISMPLFSLAPLKPPQLLSESAPYYFGGGGRLLLSMENFPRETWSSTISAGYFVGYCFGDLVLGLIHYREYTDPVSGWIHHIVYACLVYRLAITKQLSFFLVCGAPLELSTVFLAGGHMFPHLRDDFWFPVSFFFSRIVFVTLMAHEMIFNVVTPPGGTTIYVLALFMHVYWLHLYLRGRKRRVQRRKKALEQEQQTQREAMLTNGHGQKVIISKTTTTTTIVSEGAVAAYSSSVARHSEGTFQLRIKNQQTQPTQ